MAEVSKHELPGNLERYLAALSKLYAQDGERLLQRIVVNARPRVLEGWTYSSWNEGASGHAIYLVVPDVIYLEAAKQKSAIEDRIENDLNSLHNLQGEFVAKVFLEMDVAETTDWRQESGVLLQANRHVPEEAAKRIWVDGQFRLFLSHKSEVKKETAELKEKLSGYGVSCFVAHSDIQPTQAWQNEIENALATMDGFIAVMTENFHESDWTDQEVGYAFARGVPIIAVRLGRDPYGFIGKFQGLSSTWAAAPQAIAKLLINHDRMFAGYLAALKSCWNFNRANELAAILAGILNPTDQQLDGLVEAYNMNTELRGGFGFNGKRPAEYGPGLLAYLRQWTKRPYTTDGYGQIHLL